MESEVVDVRISGSDRQRINAHVQVRFQHYIQLDLTLQVLVTRPVLSLEEIQLFKSLSVEPCFFKTHSLPYYLRIFSGTFLLFQKKMINFSELENIFLFFFESFESVGNKVW